jgi:hypothetical protein
MSACPPLVTLLLGVTVVGGVGTIGIAAFAESPGPAPKQDAAALTAISKEPFRLVKLLSDTRQALLFDRNRAAHVLVTQGDWVGEFRVSEIANNQVVLTHNGRTLVLVTEPEPAELPTSAPAAAPPSEASSPPDTRHPLDPYWDPADSYRSHDVRVVLAPPGQRASLQPTNAASEVAADTSLASVAPKPSASGSTQLPRRKAKTMVLRRRELETELADFSKLGREIGFEPVPGGIRLGIIHHGSYFWRLGLRSHDVAIAIDGKALRGIDDAAAAYARIGGAKYLSIDLERAEARIALRFRLR